jgi:nucleoside-diphosphate-sugar epimerase
LIILNLIKLQNIVTYKQSELNLLKLFKDTENYISLNQPDIIIIHAAGIVGGIEANINYPVKFLVDNMQMGLNILNGSKSE